MAQPGNALDPVDLQLLDALQRDASQRLEDLGRLVGLVPSSVHDRLRRLERDGLLQRWTVQVDHEAVGRGVLAFIGVSTDRPCSQMIKDLKAITAIEECHSVAGELSMLLKVRVSDTPALLDLVERLRQIPGVEGTQSTVVLKTQLDRPVPLVPPALTPRKGARR